MAVPFASFKKYGDDDLQLYYPLLMTSPAIPQAGDSYLSDIALRDISIKSIYMEGGHMEPNLDWDGSRYDWASGVTEIQSDFVDAGGESPTGNFNLLKNTALSTFQSTHWTSIFEKPYVEGSDDIEQPYNWIYSKSEPSDHSKIWVDTREEIIEPKYYQNGWKNYYDSKQKEFKGEVGLVENKRNGNAFRIYKAPKINANIGIAQFVPLKIVLWQGDAITVGFNLSEKTDSGGAVIRIEFYDSNRQLIQTKYSPRFFNKTEESKHFGHPFIFTDRTKAAAFIRVSILGVEDRKSELQVNRIKAETGMEDTGWNLHEEELLLNLNAGEIDIPMLNGEVDKSKLISEIAILRSVLGEGLLKWEEVTRLKSSSVQEAILYDYFIENGNYYRYALQPILANGMKGAITSFYDTVTTFDGFWLLGEKDEQFSFIYNGKIGEISYVKPRDVIQTIAGQYPYFVTSSELDYRTYQFSGTLTYHQDVHKLLTSDSYSVAISPDPTIPISYVELKYGDEMLLNMKNDLEEVQDGMVMQRIWRNKILAWLNDGKPKILKSEAQGNMLVMLTNIKVTPNEPTFGLISDFECTVTEIGKLDEKALQKYKLRKSSIMKDELVKEAMKNTSF